MLDARINKLKELIYDLIPEDGATTVGNKALIRTIGENGYSEEEYWKARDELINEGVIKTGRGMGGSLRRLGIERGKKILLDLIPEDGSTVGNKHLMMRLGKRGISSEEYWNIRNKLIDDGILSTGRGQGGSVYRLDVKKAPPPPQPEKYPKEKHLYIPFEDVIRNFWIKDNNLRIDQCIIEITANQGQRKTGGKWTRPDLTVISVKTYQYIPGKILDVTTFEIKPADDIDVKGVFETASHSRFAHKSYLAVYLPKGIKDSDELIRLLKECERFGIGFIYFKDPADWSTYETKADPKRQNPDPEDINQFISSQISMKNQRSLAEKLK